MGNHSGHLRSATFDGFEPPTPREVRLEAAAFAVRRRVRIVAASPDRVHAVVRAGRPYDVLVRVAAGAVHATCDCVAFDPDGTPCRHVYATLIQIQNDDLLRLAAPTAAAR